MAEGDQTPAAPAPAQPGQQVIVAPAGVPGGAAPQEMFPRSYVEELRQENAKYRTNAKEASTRAEQAEARIKQLEPLEGQIKSLKVDAALSEVISAAGVDAKLTKALLRDEIGALDPGSDKFKDSLTALVEKAAKETPALKSATTPTGPKGSGAPKAGSDITHPNTQTPVAQDQWTEEQLAAARKAGDHEAIAKAQKEGKLKAIIANRGGR